MPAPHHSVFTGRMPFLPPNQQCQSTDKVQTKIREPIQWPHLLFIHCEYGCSLSTAHKQESAFEKKLSEAQKQMRTKVQQYKVMSIYYSSASLSASFNEWLFAALLSAYSIFPF